MLNPRNMKTVLLVVSMICMLSGCMGDPNVLTQAIDDPLFEISNELSVGLVPAGAFLHPNTTDELIEKRILLHCKSELEKRGFDVVLIDPKALHKNPNGDVNYQGLPDNPDLVLTVSFGVLKHTERVPDQWRWDADVGRGKGAYDRTTKQSRIAVNLCSVSPQLQRVWTGRTQRSDNSLIESSGGMIKQLFLNEFPVRAGLVYKAK